MALKWLFFQKITKNRPTAGGFAPRPPKPPAAGDPAPRPSVCDTFELHWLSQNVFKITYLHFSTRISLSPLPLQNPGYVPTGKFLMTSLHVICGLGLPNQKFWLRL